MEKKKKYVKPVADTTLFDTDDIITYSNRGAAPDDWGETPEAEDWGGSN